MVFALGFRGLISCQGTLQPNTFLVLFFSCNLSFVMGVNCYPLWCPEKGSPALYAYKPKRHSETMRLRPWPTTEVSRLPCNLPRSPCCMVKPENGFQNATTTHHKLHQLTDVLSFPWRTCPSGITAVMSWKATVHKLHARAMQLRTWGFGLHSEWTLLLLSCSKVWHQSLVLTTRKHFQWQLFVRPKHKMDTELMHKQSLLFILIPTAAPTLLTLTFLLIQSHSTQLVTYHATVTSVPQKLFSGSVFPHINNFDFN